MLEGRDLSEWMSGLVFGRWPSRRKDIDRNKFVVDCLFFQRKANGTDVDAVRLTENDRTRCALHQLSPYDGADASMRMPRRARTAITPSCRYLAAVACPYFPARKL